jgi:hypothetical protein
MAKLSNRTQPLHPLAHILHHHSEPHRARIPACNGKHQWVHPQSLNHTVVRLHDLANTNREGLSNRSLTPVPLCCKIESQMYRVQNTIFYYRSQNNTKERERKGSLKHTR